MGGDLTPNEADLRRDLAAIARQEAQLVFAAFDEDTAWRLGSALREAARARGVAVTIDIRRGQDILFFHAMAGTGPGNADWARRKRNAVELVRRCSYALGLENRLNPRTLEETMGLPARDYTCHGGCFPIQVKGTGHIGTVTVSGLPQREDHNLVVEVLARMIGVDPDGLKLD
jgi:uncharacterized protein (UPF0303 family)